MLYGKLKGLFSIALAAVSCNLSGVVGNPYLISDDRVRSLDVTPVLGRGYSIMTNSFQSICLEVEEITIPSYNYDYSFYQFQGSDNLEVTMAGDLSNTFVYSRLKGEVTKEFENTGSTTSETYYVVAIMRIERYYANIRDQSSKLSDDAVTLLERQDYIGFFKACGPNFIRGIRRAQEVSGSFKFTSTSAETASLFTKSLKVAKNKNEFGTSSSSSSQFSSITSSLEIKITGYGLGLSLEGSETLLATNLEEFNGVMKFAFNTMTKNPDAAHIGMVYGMEVAPWTENIKWQIATGVSETVIEIPIPRSVIPRSFIRDGSTINTVFNSTIRGDYQCRDPAAAIDKYGFCCEEGMLYDYLSGVYNPENPELRICRPLRQLEPAIIRENMAANGEFIARLDRSLRFKMNTLSTLEKCVSAVRSIPERFDYYYLKPNENVLYDRDVSFVFTVIDMKLAMDPFNDFSMVKALGIEIEEFVDQFYSPCLAQLFGANIGKSPNTDATFFMAYPWHTHPSCTQLSCLANHMRWDRTNGDGCTPSIITRPSTSGYTDDDEFCTSLADEGYDATPTCKTSSTKLSSYHTSLTTCWDSVVPSGRIDYFMDHFCMPTLSAEVMEGDDLTAKQTAVAGATCENSSGL